MHIQGVGDFPYYVGVNSLAELATKEDRVVVLNMLGKESSGVTPVSHEYSGGNIVFGTGPGKSGKFLQTKLGKIPVYNSIKEGRAAGHKFNTVVVYLPPSGVKDGVAGHGGRLKIALELFDISATLDDGGGKLFDDAGTVVAHDIKGQDAGG